MNIEQLKNKKVIISLLLLIIGIPLTVFLALKQQEIRSRASGGGVHFELSPAADTKNPDQTFSVDVNINAEAFSLSGLDTNIAINKDIVDFVSFVPASFDTVISNNYSPSTGTLRIAVVNTGSTPLVGTVKVGTLTLKAKTVGTATVTVQADPQVVALGQETQLQIGANINGSYAIVPTSTPTQSPTPPSAANYDGYFDQLSCNQLYGWAADRSKPNTPISVDIYSDGIFSTQLVANIYRPGVDTYLGDDGKHGFYLTTPASLKDKPHTVTVKYAGTSKLLNTNNKTISCNASIPYYDGYFDLLSCNRIYGWAADRSKPNTPISVDIYSDNNLLTTENADKSRPDVGKYLGDNGIHGFDLTTPASLKDNNTHTVVVKYAGTEKLLGTNSKKVTCGTP